MLDAIFNISKRSMMPEWHQLDSSSTMPTQQESTKKKTLKSSSRSFWFSTGLNIIASMKCEDHHTRKPIKVLTYTCLYLNKGNNSSVKGSILTKLIRYREFTVLIICTKNTRYKKLYFPSVIVQQITLATRAIFRHNRCKN